MLDLAMLVIVLAVFGAVIAIIRRADARAARPVALAIAAWLAITGLAAAAGALSGGGPPRAPLFGLAAIAGALAASRTSRGRSVVAAIRPSTLVVLQTFRVFVELLLWRLFVAGVVPVQMTFEGRNFDVLVGLSAIPIAIASLRRPGLARAWHVAGLVLLVNIVAIAVLSAPGPQQVFTAEPANRILGAWPYVWLPTFLVPVAAISHVLGLRRSIG